MIECFVHKTMRPDVTGKEMWVPKQFAGKKAKEKLTNKKTNRIAIQSTNRSTAAP